MCDYIIYIYCDSGVGLPVMLFMHECLSGVTI